jgi:hypothetical protein
MRSDKESPEFTFLGEGEQRISRSISDILSEKKGHRLKSLKHYASARDIIVSL